MAKIPEFKTLDEAAEFWDTHDFEEYVDDTEPITLTVTMPRRTKRLTVPLGVTVYQQIEALAASRGVRPEAIVSAWLEERLAQEELARGAADDSERSPAR